MNKVNEIKEALEKALNRIEDFSECAALDYPAYYNIGDHLIWLGMLSWIADVKKARVSYAASRHDYSAEKLEEKTKKGPIFLTGGGNFGDLWPPHQCFREAVIARHRDRPVIVMPQSIFFKSPAELEKSKRILNSHPNLTIFARDDYSYELAYKHFTSCKVWRSPDVAFQLNGILKRDGEGENLPLLYHCRADRESQSGFAFRPDDSSQGCVADWVTMTPRTKILQKFIRKMPFLWGMPFTLPLETGMKSRVFRRSAPYAEKLKTFDRPALHLRSLHLTMAGVDQFSRYRFVITNRLHGHILCVLLEIPHVFLPNAYHKNSAFYSTWTSKVSFCRFVTDASKVFPAMREIQAV